MTIYLTAHGVKRVKDRWPDKQRNVTELINTAFDKGRLPDDEETTWLFNNAIRRPGAFMLEYRIYEKHFFVYEMKLGSATFVTMFQRDPNFRKYQKIKKH